MGLLKDERYWGRVLSRVEGLRPLPGESMSRENAVKVIREACLAFSDLVQDAEFQADVKETVTIGLQAQRNTPRDDKAFREFVDRFRKVEREVLMQSGVSERATVEIEAELSELVRVANTSDLDRVEGKIRRIRDVCCGHASDPAFLNEPPRDLSADVLDALKGIATVGVDIGAMHHGAPIIDDFVGISIGAGLSQFRPLLRRIW